MRGDLLALGALCAITFFVGLTTHGLTNWQEAQRALVARDMAARGDWLVPTVDGVPYLAKPPMIYWAQMAVAGLRGDEPSELDLRLVVALSGALGVLATYFVARRLLADTLLEGAAPAVVQRGAFWSAATLATGTLYVRSSRIGELDILLVPAVVVAVGAVHHAWRRWRLEGRQSPWAILLAAAAACCAALTKGPPGVLVIGLAGYGAIVLDSAWSGRQSTRRAAVGVVAGLLTSAATTALVSGWPRDANETLGLALLSIGLAWVGAEIARADWLVVLRALARTHPVIVLGAPLGALWAWGALVSRRIGHDAVAGAAAAEAEDNLRIWVLDSPVTNVEAASYGVGLGSALAIIMLLWLARRRPRFGPGWAVTAAWVGLSMVAFSVLGKGVARYLTPMWPGVAMIAGLGVALASMPAGAGGLGAARFRGVRAGLCVIVVALGAGQGLWYGYGREALYQWRSPRSLVRELQRAGLVDAPPVSLDIWEPSLDYYVGARVQPYTTGLLRAPGFVRPRDVAQLRADLEAAGGGWRIVFLFDRPDDDAEPGAPIEALRRAGLMVQTLPIRSAWRIDESPVTAVRVAPAPGPG